MATPVSFFLSLPLAMLSSGLIAVIVSTIALRTVDDYFIIITLGIQVIAFSIMNNVMSLTNGPLGISGIPSISLFGASIDNKLSILFLILIISGLVYYVINNITKSPFGRILISISQDEIFTKSLGKNVYAAKIISFAMGAMLAAIPGALYAHYVSYIDPSSFTVNESIFILSIVIIGGSKNLCKVSLATVLLILLPELLRFIGMSGNMAANAKQILYGSALVITIFNYGKQKFKQQHVNK